MRAVDYIIIGILINNAVWLAVLAFIAYNNRKKIKTGFCGKVLKN